MKKNTLWMASTAAIAEAALAQPISSVPNPHASDAISGKNSEVEQTDTKESVDDSDEK